MEQTEAQAQRKCAPVNDKAARGYRAPIKRSPGLLEEQACPDTAAWTLQIRTFCVSVAICVYCC